MFVAVACIPLGTSCIVGGTESRATMITFRCTGSTQSTDMSVCVCTAEGSSWTTDDFQQHIVDEHLAAIAEALALALALDTGSGGFCLAAASASTYVH